MNDIDAGRSLELAGSLNTPLRWLVVLMGIPLGVTIVGLSLAYSHSPPAAHVPFLVAVITGPVIIVIAAIFLVSSLRRVGVRIDRGELVVNTGLGSKRVALAHLHAHGLQIVDLNQRTELKPLIRTWGTSLPGFSAGWFRLRNGEKAVGLLLDRHRVSYLRGDDGTSLLLSLAHPETLRVLLER